MHEGCVSNPVSNLDVSNEGVSNGSPDYLRVKLWRQANRDRYNAGQSEYMKKRRQLGKELKEKRDA